MGSAIFILVFKILCLFAVIGCGILAYKAKFVDEHTTKQMSNYLNNVAIPIFLITAVGTKPILDGSKYLVFCGIVMGLYYLIAFGGVYLITKLRGLSRAKRAVYTSMSVIPNCAFVGLPLVQMLLGENAVPYIGIMMTAFNIVFFTVGIQMFNKDGKFNLKTILTPLNISTVIMLVLLLTNTQLNEYVYTFLSQITAIVSPVCLLIIGVNIARSSIKNGLKNPVIWLLSFLKLIAFPVIVQLCLMPFDFPVTMKMALLIGIACPGSTMATVFANQNDMEPELASQSVAHSTVFSIITLPILIVAGEAMYGLL